MSTRTFSIVALALLASAMAPAATISTTLTVNATATLGISGGTIAGTAAFTGGIGSGTLAASVPLTALVSDPAKTTFTITGLPGGTLTGSISVPQSVLTGGATAATSVKMTFTGGTGTYAGATSGEFTLTGSVSGDIVAGFKLTNFTGSGTITTGGGTTGPPTPTISTIQNNYGQIPVGYPNYAIAPSTLFFIKGASLSNSSTSLLSSADPGLPTTLNGVTVTVTSGGTTLQCPLYYLLPTQIAAVLPGTTPVSANATITVSNNGGTSAPFPIVIAKSAFGILSYNGSLAAAYDASNAILTATNSANPNQAIVLWGSGVGYDPADDDKLYPQKQNNLTDIPMKAYVGGVEAAIAYRGRSQFPGVDQVVLTIPGSAPTGCYVSLSIVSDTIVSNSVTIPIAASGKTCSDPNSGLTPDMFQNLAGKTTIREGILTVAQATTITSSGTRTDGTVGGIFQSVTGFATSSGGSQVSLGSCLVIPPTDPSAPTPAAATGLDAGASIAVTGPGGNVTLSQLSVPGVSLAGFYAPPNGLVPGSFIPATGGAFVFDNGAGGKDVQHFNATLNLPAAFTWTNAAAITSVNRSQGVNVTWSGGAAGSYVSISGSSQATVGGKQISASYTCLAPVAAGQFTVPPPVLLSLPAGTGTMSVADYTNVQLFNAPGLDLGLLIGGNSTSKSPIPHN